MKKVLLLCFILWASGCACQPSQRGIYNVREFNIDGHHIKQYNRDRLFALTPFGCGHYMYTEIDGKMGTPVWIPEIQ